MNQRNHEGQPNAILQMPIESVIGLASDIGYLLARHWLEAKSNSEFVHHKGSRLHQDALRSKEKTKAWMHRIGTNGPDVEQGR